MTSTFDGLALARDGSADLVLPSDWLTMLLNGSATGVCVTSSSRSDYLILGGASAPSGTLTFNT